MKVAIVDACIFMDLYSLDMLSPFFGLPISVHTSHDLICQLKTTQKDNLKEYIAQDKLFIHTISGLQRNEIYSKSYPEQLSPTSITAIFISEQIDAEIILSSTSHSRKYLGEKCFHCHGIFWILDQVYNNSIINFTKYSDTLNRFKNIHRLYESNVDITNGVSSRIGKSRV